MLQLSELSPNKGGGMPNRLIAWVSTVVALLLTGQAPDLTEGRGQAPTPQRIEANGIENLFCLSPRLFSGGQPEGEKGFETLKRLGIKTVISVDGSQPDVEAARRLGLRYVHLPVGYDGIPRDQAIRLVKAIRELPGPVFVHCHHGKHRGPAAAAVCALATEGWERTQARSWLERAGADPKYKGLFATVDGFTPLSVEEVGRAKEYQLPERTYVPALVESMVEIDRIWDHLKEIQKAGFRTPKDSPHLDPSLEALMLVEKFRETSRREGEKSEGEEFNRLLANAERDAAELMSALRKVSSGPSPVAQDNAQAAIARVNQDCASCHVKFRDSRNRAAGD
jgi:protein tyrosine phosphatase (PTP) superfamily phosphohydrolase (DUF442 family)/cytochrome c556